MLPFWEIFLVFLGKWEPQPATSWESCPSWGRISGQTGNLYPELKYIGKMGGKDGNPACTGSPTARWKSGLQSDCPQLSSPAGLKIPARKRWGPAGNFCREKISQFPSWEAPIRIPSGELPLGMQHWFLLMNKLQSQSLISFSFFRGFSNLKFKFDLGVIINCQTTK